MRRLHLGAPLLALALGGPAFGADPVTPRIGPEAGPSKKAERVLAALPDAETKLWRERVGKGEVAPRDLVHRILVERDAAYRAAVATFDKDGANAEEFEKLAAGADSSALGQALRAHATWYAGRAYLNRDEFEPACNAFEKVRGELRDATAWTDEATLYLGYSYARRPELEEDKERLYRARAKSCLESLVPADGSTPVYASAPERTRESASWLVKELEGEGSGPLLELARRMETIEHQIDLTKTGRPTQRKQEQVIAEIDRLIELMREKEGGG